MVYVLNDAIASFMAEDCFFFFYEWKNGEKERQK